MVDADTIVHPDCPNFFNMTGHKYCGVNNVGSVDWILRSIENYSHFFFKDINLPYWEYSSYPELNFNLLTQLNYFSAELDQYGNIVNDHNWNNLYLVPYAHERDVKVKLCATLFGQAPLTTLLSDSIYRQNAINNLVELVINKNADGVDIDFELLPSSQRENLVLFMEELSEIFHNQMEDPIMK